VFINFDTANGLVQFGERTIVRAGMTVSDLKNVGVTFIRDFDMKTGWVLRQAAPLMLDGKRVTWSFSFKDERLEVVRFAISHELERNIDLVREKHDAFLFAELGPADEESTYYTVYRYQWGEISSGVDVRNGSSSISVRWIG
jgi:hypothetical protein